MPFAPYPAGPVFCNDRYRLWILLILDPLCISRASADFDNNGDVISEIFSL
jgi:hypothetical protein